MGNYLLVSNIKNYSQTTFEDIKHFTKEGIEFWYATSTGSIRIYQIGKVCKGYWKIKGSLQE